MSNVVRSVLGIKFKSQLDFSHRVIIDNKCTGQNRNRVRNATVCVCVHCCYCCTN